MIALMIQIDFIIKTIPLFFHGCVECLGQPMNSFHSMVFTLIIVVCEIVSFADAVLFAIFKRSVYSFVYLALFVANAANFMKMAYYSNAGTAICFISYGLLFVLRVLNLILNGCEILRGLKHSVHIRTRRARLDLSMRLRYN